MARLTFDSDFRDEETPSPNKYILVCVERKVWQDRYAFKRAYWTEAKGCYDVAKIARDALATNGFPSDNQEDLVYMLEDADVFVGRICAPLALLNDVNIWRSDVWVMNCGIPVWVGNDRCLDIYIRKDQEKPKAKKQLRKKEKQP